MADVGRALVTTRSGPPGTLGRVRWAGRVEGGRGVATGPLRRYDGHALVYVFGGHGRYRDPHLDVPLRAGDLISVLPGHPHWYGVTGPETWNEVHFVVDGPVAELAQHQGLLDARRPVRRLLPVDYWVERIDHFRVRRPPVTAAGADDEVCSVLRLLVEIAARAETRQDHGTAVPSRRSSGGWLATSRAMLAADLGDPLDLHHVAASVGLPYESWRKYFTAETGVPPARWRQLRRVDAASELLRRTGLTTRDIAVSLGFSDGHHLSKVFRQVTGMTTGEFRRTMG